MIDYVWLVPLLPLVAAIWTGLSGERLGEKAGLVAVGGIFSSFLVVLSLFLTTVGAQSQGVDPFPTTVPLFTWMEIAGHKIEVAFLVDQLSMIMMLVVTFLGSLIFSYARGYMHGDPGYPRFFTYLSLFAFSMLVLVLGDSYLLMFVGWEGVGLCSYLLIGYFFKEGWCADAGRKAFIANRIGDFGLLLAMFLMLGNIGSVRYHEVIAAAPGLSTGVLTAITFCLLIAATGKSAQIPLYVWLPDAMAGPTPVSALIHAATMVTAGIYLIVRSNVLFVLSPVTMALVACIGAATALVAALIACTQTDIKKVLAYSTVSQLGYMFLALGVGAFGAAMFHVFTHAFFKGCLFLCAGSVIHAMHHEQDMRNMGGLKKKMPITAATYLISTVAIAGIPPLAGFFSKDEILWRVVGMGLSTFNPFYLLLWGVGFATAALTSFYMFRSYFMTFEGPTRADHHTWDHAHESPKVMTNSLVVLAFGAAVVGVLGILPWMGHLPGLHFLEQYNLLFSRYLAPVADAGNHLLKSLGEHEYHPHFSSAGLQLAFEVFFAALSVAIAVAGLLVARALYFVGKPAESDAKLAKIPGYAAAKAKFFVDEVYESTVIASVLRGSKRATGFDRDGIDGTIGKLIGGIRDLAMQLRTLQTGQIQAYALAFMGGLILFLLLGIA